MNDLDEEIMINSHQFLGIILKKYGTDTEGLFKTSNLLCAMVTEFICSFNNREISEKLLTQMINSIKGNMEINLDARDKN